MTEISINTAQNVTINFKPASLGERIIAFAVDMAIKMAYVTVLYYLYDVLNWGRFFNGFDGWEQGVVSFVLFIPFIFYTLFFESWTNGQTPGKRVMKIRVVKLEGYQARFSDHFARWLFRLIDVFIMGGLPAILGVVFSSKSQRLGDMVTDTTVISMKSNVQLNHRFLEDLTEEYVVSFPTVLRLSDHDMAIIKKAYHTAIIQNDVRMVKELISKIEEVAAIKNNFQNPHHFMQTVINDFNHLTSR